MARETALKVAITREGDAYPTVFNNVAHVLIDGNAADKLSVWVLDQPEPIEFTDEEYGSVSVMASEITDAAVVEVPLPLRGVDEKSAD